MATDLLLPWMEAATPGSQASSRPINRLAIHFRSPSHSRPGPRMVSSPHSQPMTARSSSPVILTRTVTWPWTLETLTSRAPRPNIACRRPQPPRIIPGKPLLPARRSTEALSAAVLTRINASVPAAVMIATLAPIGVADPLDDSQQGIAPGELILITGSGLGPSQAVGAQVSNGRIPTTLAGTTVTFDGAPAPLISVQANQIVCVVPFAAGSVRATTLQIASGGTTSNSVLVGTQRAQVEIFVELNQDGTQNSQTHPAVQGSTVTVYASASGKPIRRARMDR